MNAIALFLALVLQGNPTCEAQPADYTTISGQRYAVQQYQCYWRGPESDPSHRFEVWSPVCRHYVAQPILISERNVHKGWAMNEFGEFYPATHDVDLMYVYRPPCGGEHEPLSTSDTGEPGPDGRPPALAGGRQGP